MTDHRDDPSSPAGANPSEATETGAAEDLRCLQSALDYRQREHERRRADSHAMQADVQAKLQQAELRLQQTVSQLEANKRSTQAMRVRLEADIQAARARARQAQEALAASQDTSEQLRMTNAELSTALDALQWRLGELEAENAMHRETLLHTEQQRLADHQRLTELDAERASLCGREADLQRQLVDLGTVHEAARAAWETECDTLKACLAEQQRARAEATEALAQAHAAHAHDVRNWQDTAAQHAADLHATRLEAAALTARVRDVEAEILAAHQLRHEAEERLSAAQSGRAETQARLDAERSALEEELRQLRMAHSDALAVWEERAAQHVGHAEALASHAHSLEADLRQREACIDQLWNDLAQREERHLQAMQAVADDARRRQWEWSAARQRVQGELDSARQALADLAASQSVVQEHLEERDRELCEIRQRAEAATAGAQRSEEDRARAEQRAAEVELRCHALTQQLEILQKQSEQTEPRRDAIAGQITELERERSTLSVRVDELTALNGQLERECDRLRRDRGSVEETRRLKADNARLENKIVELDRQRSEAAQRHSAAVAGYMVELNQRSEALQARQMELQKLTEELTLVKQSCEDAMSDLAAQRREQAALERELTKSRATPAPTAIVTPSDPIRPTPIEPQRNTLPPAARPAATKPVRRPSQADPMTGPVTVVHLEESTTLCDAARDVVARMPDARYMNALDATSPDAPGSRVLVVNLLSRTHNPVEAIASFIAANTYHRNVLAYCADGANGFCFGTADFFTHPIDPDACVARLLESLGAIQRLLVVTEHFGVVGALRDILSRMQSSVSAALDLRQVIDLLPMVDPDVILIDLGLARGEGLRLVSRLRSDPKTRDLALAILLATPGGMAEFRQQALRAARDMPMAPTHLAEALMQRLGVPRPGNTLTPARSDTTALA